MKPYLQPIIRTLAAIAALAVFTSVTAFAQTTLYSENFTYSNGTTQGSGTPANWTIDVSGTSPAVGSVQSNMMQFQDLDGEAEWYSKVIYINGWSSVSASVYLPGVINMGSTDYMKVYYKLNGGAETFFPTNGNLANNYSNLTASVSGLTGSTLQIVIKVTNQDADENHYIDNVTVTGTSGSLYSEDFTYSNGTTSSSKFSTTCSSCTLEDGWFEDGWFEVRSNKYDASDNDGEGVWTSSSIDISSCSSVSLSVNLTESGNLESDDYIRVYYKLNGGAETLFSTNGNKTDDFTSATASQTGLSGTTLQIVIRTKNNSTSEYHSFDDVTVTGTGCTISSISLSTTGTNINCFSPSGAVNLSITGGQAPFTFSWSNSATTEDLSGLSAGTYTVTVTGNNGATASTSHVITSSGTMTASAVVSSNYNGAHVSCPGSANGAIDLSISGGTAPYTYSWTGGATTQDLSNKTAGTYSVTVTDAAGCIANTSSTINNPTALTPSTSVTNATCPLSSNGAINLTVSGGTGSKTYLWSSGQTSEDLTSLIVEDYSVTVTDANGCTASTSASVGSASNISSAMNITHVTTPGGTNGAITQTVSGGSAPYSYLWSTGATTKDISSLAADVYLVTITDNSGCQYIGSAGVVEKVSLFCENFSSYANGTTTSANWTQTCTSCSATGSNGDWEVISNKWEGEDLDAQGVWTSSVIDISGYKSVQATVAITEAVSNNLESDDYIRIYYKLNGGAETYFTSNGDLTNDISGGAASATQSNLAGLTLQIVIRMDNDASGEFHTFDDVCVTGELAMSLAFSQTNVTCNGGSNGAVDLTVWNSGATAPFTYSWSSGATTQDISGRSAGTYTVTVTDAGGVKETGSVTITQPTAMSPNIAPTNTTCPGSANGAANLTVTGGTNPKTYLWSNGITSEDLTGLRTGTYTVTVTGALGCTATANTTISSASNMVQTLAVTNITTPGGTDGAINQTVTGNAGTKSYLWSNGATTEDLSGLAMGTYTVTVTDATGGCTKVKTAMVLDPETISCQDFSAYSNGTTSGSWTQTCSGCTQTNWDVQSQQWAAYDIDAQGVWTSPVISISGYSSVRLSVGLSEPDALESNDYIRVYYKLNGGAEVQFATNGNMTDDFTSATASQTGLSGSTVQIVIRVWNDAEHHYFDNVCVYGYPPFYVDAEQTNLTCSGGSDGAVDLTVTNGSGTLPFTFAWSNGATSEDLSGLTAGTYTVTVTDNGGLTRTKSVTLTEPPTTMSVNNTIVNVTCHGGSDATIILAVSGGTSPYSFLWSNGSSSMNPSGLSAGTYTVTVTDDNGCAVSNSYVVSSPSLPLDMTYTGTASFCSGGSTQLVASGAQNFSWTPSTGLSATNIANPVINPGTTTTYYVTASSPGASNLVANGDFESGNIGFTTQYSYTTNNLIPEGRYGIGANANTYHPSFFSSGDHTSGSGKFMIINGAVTINMKVWCQSLNVQKGASYAFSTWILSVHPSNPAQLEFSINGSLLGTAITAPSVRYQWDQFTANWTSNTTSADFCIVNRNTIAGGNDFALDDIVITPNCTDVDTITVTVNTLPAAVGDADGGDNQSICYGETAELEASGGITYSWSNGVATAANNVSPTSNTTYTVTVSSAAGCSASDNVNVTVRPQLFLAVDSVKNTICNGANDGKIYITPSGGTAPYSYAWSNGAGTQDVTGLAVGTYTVTVTDAGNCTITATRSITDVTISLDITKTDISCNNAGDGSISVTASGGIPPYGYSWSTGATAQNLGGLSAGAFSVTVTGANGCTSSGSATIVNPAALNPSATVTNITCNGLTNGAIDLSVSGGWTPYTYNWGGGVTTQDRSGLAHGLYTVTVTDARSCTATLPKLVMNAGATFSALVLTGATSSTFPTATQSGGFSQSLPASGSEDFTFTFANSYLPASFTLNPDWAGTGTMSYTKNDANATSNATHYANSRVTEYHDFNPGDVANNSGITYRMYGRGLFAFNGASGGVNHSWTVTYNFSGLANGYLPAGTLLGFTDIDGNPETALLSAVLATGSGAWLGTSPFDYTTNSTHGQPAYNAGNNTYYFDGPSVNNGAIMYFTAKNLTSITLNLTAGNGGGSFGVKFAAPASAPLTTSKTVTNVLCNGNATGAVDLTVIGGKTPYSYLWSTGATTQDLTNKVADEYWITVTDANSCTKTDSAIITQPANALSATLDITDVTCTGIEDGTITINASGGTPPYTYLAFAKSPPGPVDSSNALLIEYVPAFNDSVSPLAVAINVTDSNGCSIVVSGEVGTEGPQLSFSQTNVNCSGDAEGAIDLTVNGESPFSYSWSNGASTEDISGLTAGYYDVTVTDASSCIGTGVTEITSSLNSNISSTLTVTDVSTTGGMDGSITQSVSGGTGPYLYNWSNSASTMNISGLTSGSYAVTITDALGCTAAFSGTVEEPMSCPCTWLGAQSNVWGNANNWDCGFIPTDTCNVVIPSGTPFDCNIQANAACMNLTIQPGATLIITAANQLDIKGDLTNNGAFTRNNSVVRFTGTAEQHIYGTGQTNFWNIHISNTSGTGVRMHGNIGVYGDLRLLDGYLYTGPDTVKVETSSQGALLVFGSQSFVVGKIRRKIDNAGEHGYGFPVGDAGTPSRFFRAYIRTHDLQGTGYLTVWFDTLRNHSNANLEAALVNPPTDINNFYNYNVPVVTITGGDTATTTNYNLLGGITGGVTGWLNQTFTLEKAAEEDGIVYTYIAPEGEWKFEPDQQPTGGFYDMILYVENMSGLSDNNFGVLKRPTGSDGRYWSGGGGLMKPFNGEGRKLSDGYAMRMMLTTFSGGGAGGGGGGGLPIELLEFNAELVGDQVEITWVTATEINNEYFTIEKSDGNEFRQVAIVPGAGNSSTTRYYSRIDYDPFKGVSYYRLKQTDYDGKFEYSHVVSVTYVPSFATDNDDDVLLFPNPSTGDFSLVLKKASEAVTLLLFDAKGNLLKTFSYSAPEDNYPYNMSITGLADGIYYLKVDIGGNNNIYTKKLMLVGGH